MVGMPYLMNIDSEGSVWDASKVFPKIPMSQISDDAFSKTTGQIFLSDKGWQQAANVAAEKRFSLCRHLLS